MAGFFKKTRAFSRLKIAALLMAGMAGLPAHAAVEISSFNAREYDSIVAVNKEGGYSLRNTGFSVGDIQNMKKALESNASELASLKKVVNDQAKLIEELKRNGQSSASSSSSSNSEISSLKRQSEEQTRGIKQLEGQVSDLKRSAGSSNSSSSSELSSLKRDVSNQQRDLDNVKRELDNLSRKVK
ncbi:hypothetical protein ALQ04_00502 [Pseudomonas cichorii]|uniref:Methyl-accepting chemotaxis protein n=1 Tax=Pseudomonas cichorii TaxID=36746 RepID=A0A3M4LJC0_PSECI|nr:hypothetical protein [Pseudomonas cichorii]RMQ41592.1 hypothetical protein ALQ04_00502 [Pseudomonas cichorii]